MATEMKAKIYKVSNPKDAGQVRLVRAKTKQGALTHVARTTFDCELAGQDELVALTLCGVKAEDIAEPEPDLIGERGVNL